MARSRSGRECRWIAEVDGVEQDHCVGHDREATGLFGLGFVVASADVALVGVEQSAAQAVEVLALVELAMDPPLHAVVGQVAQDYVESEVVSSGAGCSFGLVSMRICSAAGYGLPALGFGEPVKVTLVPSGSSRSPSGRLSLDANQD